MYIPDYYCENLVWAERLEIMVFFVEHCEQLPAELEAAIYKVVTSDGCHPAA